MASEQPDDPPKCRPDERTWVCVLSSQFFSFHRLPYILSLGVRVTFLIMKVLGLILYHHGPHDYNVLLN